MWVPILTFLAFLIMVGLFYFKPAWGLFVVIFLLPFQRIGSYVLTPPAEHPIIRLVQVAGASLMAAYALLLVTRRLRLRRLGAFPFLAGLAVAGIVPVWRLHYGQITHNYVIAVGLFGLSFVIAQLSTRDNLKVILAALFSSATVVGVFGLFQYAGDIAGLSTRLTGLLPAYTKAVFGFPRIQSTASEPLYYADYLLIPFLVGMGLFIGGRRSRWLAGVMLVVTLNLILTMSRGGIFAASVGAVLLLILMRQEVNLIPRRTLLNLSGVLAASFLVASLATAAASQFYYHDALKGPKTFVGLFSSQLTKTGSYTDRQATRAKARHVFESHPIFGVGFGGYGPAQLQYPPHLTLENWPTANNAFWELLAEQGVVGFSFLLLFVGAILWQGYRALSVLDKDMKACVAGLMAATVAIIVQYQSFTGFFLTHIWVCLGLLAGLAMALDVRPYNRPRA